MRWWKRYQEISDGSLLYFKEIWKLSKTHHNHFFDEENVLNFLKFSMDREKKLKADDTLSIAVF